MARIPAPVELGGLRATVLKSRGRTADGWYWRIRRGDRTVQALRGSRADAEAAVAELVARQPQRSPPGSPEGVTVDELLADWYAWQEKRAASGRIRESTLTNYAHAVGLWRGSDVASVLTDALTLPHVEAVLLEWQSVHGLAVRSVRHYGRILTHAWRWGRDRGKCPELPIARALPAEPRADVRVNRGYTPTREEVVRILAAMPPGPARDAVILLASTGGRIGEVVSLTVDSYDPVAQELTLDGKTGPRQWPVDDGLARELRRMVADAGEDGRLVQIKGWATHKHLIKACKAAGVEETTPHGLRRYVATELLDSTGNPALVAKLTGHSVHVLLTRYVRPSRASLRGAVAGASLGLPAAGEVIDIRSHGLVTRGGKADE